MTNWLCFKKLLKNTSIRELMKFRIGSRDQMILLNDNVSFKNQCKYLGDYLENKLTFRQHITYVVKKQNKFCSLMQKVRIFFSTKHLLLFYNSYAKSWIRYGILDHGRAAKTNLEPIEKCQKRIIRTIFFRNNSR